MTTDSADVVDEEISVDRIPEVLAREMVLLSPYDVEQHPENPNEGDMEALIESITENDFYEPILVQKSTNYALSGNHRLEAGRRLRMPELPFIFLDVDDERAMAILLSSNQVGRRGHDNEERLRKILVRRGAVGLRGTGYKRVNLTTLLRREERLRARTAAPAPAVKPVEPVEPQTTLPVQFTMRVVDSRNLFIWLDAIAEREGLASHEAALLFAVEAVSAAN